MKKVVMPLCVLFLVLFLLPVPAPGNLGNFNTVTGLCWCGDAETCLHEGAHKMDRSMGWVSRSEGFHEAVYNYLLGKMADPNPDTQAFNIQIYWAIYRLNREQELYANLFMWADGRAQNMPADFRQFYDWDRSLDYVNACWRIG